MQIVDDKALLLRTTNPQQITDHVRKSKVINQEGDEYDVAVNWGLDEAQALAALSVGEVPSPILRDYQWTGRFTPFAHQKETASFLTLHPKAFCFSEAGTGKTAAAIWAADYLMRLGRIKRVLVLCPLSIMKSAWQQDLFKFAMHRSCAVAHGSAATRKKIINAGAEFVVINFDGLATVKEDAIAAGFDLIIADECFVAGTPAQTPGGPVPIDTIQAGDFVVTSSGPQRVARVIQRTASAIVEVSTSDGHKIRCTPEHPFFTDAGWVRARDLTGRVLVDTHALRGMRRGVLCADPDAGMAPGARQRALGDNLLEILRTEEMARGQPGEERPSVPAPGTAGETTAGSQALAGDEGQNIGYASRKGAQAPRAWWQRAGHDSCGGDASADPAPGMGMELPGSVGEEAARLSYVLQARLRGPTEEAGFGGGRGLTHGKCAESAGQEEGGEAGGIRVESVTHIELSGTVPVYNLDVEGTPNYFVGDGLLVHNCTAYKNAQTARWKVLRDVALHSKWLWMMTGTPAAQSPLDAYGLAKLVNPDALPRYWGAYRDQVMYKVTQFKWAPKKSARDVVHRVLQPAIRFEKAQCLDLPPVLHVERDAPLTPMQTAYYAKLKNQMRFEAADESVTAVNAATSINKLLQISGGAVYTDTGEVVEFDISNRMNVVLEAIEEAAHKVLVFVPFTHTIELLRDTLTKHKISCDVLNGAVPMNRRSQIIEDFQKKPDPHVLLIQPQAAAHGLTLTAADTVIWYAPVTSVETYLQANARIDRPGQKNNMTVVHIQGSDVEAKLYAMLRMGIVNHTKIVDLYRRAIDDTP